ncbi:MAG: amidinotransferase [Alphaproteobacteria bacterium]|nr:amidinotransferase [Alphaproteobacteria bacterium]
MKIVVDSVEGLGFAPHELAERPAEVGVLMADAAHFDVEYVINPFMEGHLHSVDRARAVAQWQALQAVYAGLGYQTHTLASVEGLPDLVFMANQSFPAQLPTGEWVALMSVMESHHRRPEVEVVEAWYTARGARTLRMTKGDHLIPFEGMGDAHWFPGRRLVVGGYGFRTSREAYDRIAAVLDVPVVALRLTDPRFYHLDTCLAPLDAETALYVPSAFEARGRALLERLFPRLIEVPLDEAVDLLACNGHCPDQRHFVVQRGATETNRRVQAAGFDVIEVDTGEFLKSGGSVFCMKLMIP